MYNRYIPQSDGSYRRSRIPEQHTPPPVPPEPKPQPVRPAASETGAVRFLKNLLPRDLDTGDLLVVVLLLLMSERCEEDRNLALLTLALYFFM